MSDDKRECDACKKRAFLTIKVKSWSICGVCFEIVGELREAGVALESHHGDR